MKGSFKMQLYLAGPMRSIKDFNFPAFNAAAAKLRAAGHEVFNPAEKGLEKDAGAQQEPVEDDALVTRCSRSTQPGYACMRTR